MLEAGALFYERLGFRRIPFRELTPALAEILDREAMQGLDPATRLAMRLELGAAQSDEAGRP